eukprot:1151279-Pelagomonas_calceolata.AAC.5
MAWGHAATHAVQQLTCCPAIVLSRRVQTYPDVLSSSKCAPGHAATHAVQQHGPRITDDPGMLDGLGTCCNTRCPAANVHWAQ